MATNQVLVEKALGKIGYPKPISQNVLVPAYEELIDFISEIQANGMNLEYDFDSTLTEESNVSINYNSALASLLAKRLAETFGVVVSSQLEMQASSGAQILAKGTIQRVLWKQPNRMPIGSGNNKNGYEWRRYYSDVQFLPTTTD